MSTQSFTLPSGAKLEVTLSPFAVSKALYQAIAEDLKEIRISAGSDVAGMLKDAFCAGISSKRIEQSLRECMKKATYNGVRITDDTWEPEESRQDYLPACLEVASVNVRPFMKSLWSQYADTFRSLQDSLSSISVTQKPTF